MSSTKKGRDFEIEVAKKFTHLGWEVSFTPISGDEGCDLIAVIGSEKLVIQCKDWKNSVGREAVQEIYTAKAIHDAHSALVICRRYFTNQARETAQKLNVHLSSLAAIEKGGPWDRSVEGERLRQEWKREKEEEKIAEDSRNYERRKAALDASWKIYKDDKVKYEIAESKRSRLFVFFITISVFSFSYALYQLYAKKDFSVLAILTTVVSVLTSMSFSKSVPEPSAPVEVILESRNGNLTPDNPVLTGHFQCSTCDDWIASPQITPSWAECPKCKKYLWVTPSLGHQ